MIHQENRAVRLGKFVLKVVAFSAVLVAAGAWVLSRANGSTDAYYLRFTTPPQSSMILGTSRAAQGLVPSVLNKELGRKDMFNYAFTVSTSPYGPTYYHSIEKKLIPSTKEGVFVLNVDPWCVGGRKGDPNDENNFQESKRTLRVPFVAQNPNFYYLLTEFSEPYAKLLFSKTKVMVLEKDGWLKVNAPMGDAMVAKRTREKVEDYRKLAKTEYQLSEKREEWLLRTAQFLKQHGRVYMVRLPADTGLLAVEQAYYPRFNETMRKIAQQAGAKYLDMTPEAGQFLYTDGNHLHQSSAAEVSKRVAAFIRQNPKGCRATKSPAVRPGG